MPDTLVGTDSHTTMINGLGVVGWGVGGIEAEAVMLGQPLYMLMPEVVGFELTGQLPPGATATDLVLTVTQILRKEGVVGKFVEFFGPGVSNMTLADRATIGNMAPEYGATMGFFPVDDETLELPAPHRPHRRPKSSWSSATTKEQGCSAPTTDPTPTFTKTAVARSGHGRAEPGRAEAAARSRAAGGHEDVVSQSRCGRRSPSAASRSTTPALRRTANVADNGHSTDDRPRRRRHRRHHQLHEHQQSVGDARRRPAGQEGRREGAESRSRT